MAGAAALEAEGEGKNMEKFIMVSMAKESARILIKYSFPLIPITILLMFPYSLVTLISHTFLGEFLLTSKLAIRIESIALASGYPESRYLELICYRISQGTLSSILCFPIMISFSLSFKALVFHTVSSTHVGLGLTDNISALPTMWMRLLFTYSYTIFLVIASNATVLMVLLMWTNAVAALGQPLATWMVYLGWAAGVLYCFVFAQAMMVCNMANVVSVLEDRWGLDALYRAKCLVRGKTDIALFMSLFTNLGMACVEGLFQYRVYRGACFWEGPSLIFLYSMVGLVDNVMTAMFYYTCRTMDRDTESFWEYY